MKPVVCHFNNQFFIGSQTFIYNYVSSYHEYRPVLLAREFLNLEQFPFNPADRYLIRFKQYTPRWLINGLYRKWFGIEWATEKVIRKCKGCLIHAHFGDNGFRILNIKMRLGLPLVTTFYGYDLSQLPGISDELAAYEKLFRLGDLFLVEGEFMKSALIGLGCPGEKVQIQRIAIRLDKIEFNPPQPKRKDHPVHLLFSARFVEKKGLMDALEAVLMTRATHKNFAFKIIGSGPLEAEATRFIAENDMKDYVSLLGFLPYEDYLREMRSADIFLQSSKTARNGDSEGGAPTTILEAQATGKPVIATRHADIPNIVVENKSALLSDEGDRDGLSNNIISLLNRQDEWVAMGAAGRAFVEKYHNIDTEIINLEEKYHRLLSMGSTVFQK